LWAELMKNLSPAAKSELKIHLCHGHLDQLTAVALFHILCMGALNNPTMWLLLICRQSGWFSVTFVGGADENEIISAMAIWTNSLRLHCFICSVSKVSYFMTI
jgi:hypothetical protein